MNGILPKTGLAPWAFEVELGLDYIFPECGLTPYLNAAWINRRVTNSVTTASVDPSLVPGPNAISYGRASYKTQQLRGGALSGPGGA